ncbi:hypothetical protein [Moorena producens]|nr:hypothetical protein [Moorena producens]
MQYRVGETTPVAHGGNPLFRSCIACLYPHTPHPVPLHPTPEVKVKNLPL